ncbi:MAG: sigma-54 dependent transcriptional regulator [Bacteroidota bacterium]
MKGKILIVDDNKSVLTALEFLLQDKFKEVHTLSNTNTLLSVVKTKLIDVVLLDMNFRSAINTGNEGIFWLKEIMSADPTISVIMITAHGDVNLAVKAVKLGAFDFVLKPWDNNKLVSTVQAGLKLRDSKNSEKSLKAKNETLKKEINTTSKTFIGRSPAIMKVLKMVEKVAKTEANIFITGENGTGKELIAREIHQLSKRNKEIMVNVDMGAVSETLFESELFGHKKGAFTDAKEDRVGKFETANKGSLFLDEIGNLSLDLQAKILVALQNRKITPIGSNNEKPIDIRLISATNKDLNEMIENRSFREDLLYRINTITIELPPLRDRENDVILLAEFYLQKYSNKYDKPGLRISQNAQNKLLKYNWPGNVRELQHSVEKAVILAEDKLLTENDFNLRKNNSSQSTDNFATIEEMEKHMILKNIDKEMGNMSAVAKNLGITRQTLYNKLKKYGI